MSFETEQSEIVTQLAKTKDNTTFNTHCRWLQSKGYTVHCIESTEFEGEDKYTVTK